MAQYVLNEIKQHKIVFIVFLIVSILIYLLATFIPEMTFMLFIPLNWLCMGIIVYLAYQYYARFYGKYSITTKTLNTQKWKPFLAFFICSLLILALATFMYSIFSNLVSSSFSIIHSNSSINTDIALKLDFSTLFSQFLIFFKGYMMVLSTLIFVISLSCSNCFKHHNVGVMIAILILVYILITFLNNLFISASFIFELSFNILDIILFIIFSILSFILYIKHGVVQS